MDNALILQLKPPHNYQSRQKTAFFKLCQKRALCPDTPVPRSSIILPMGQRRRKAKTESENKANGYLKLLNFFSRINSTQSILTTRNASTPPTTARDTRSFADLKTIDGHSHATHREACLQRGVIDGRCLVGFCDD